MGREKDEVKEAVRKTKKNRRAKIREIGRSKGIRRWEKEIRRGRRQVKRQRQAKCRRHRSKGRGRE